MEEREAVEAGDAISVEGTDLTRESTSEEIAVINCEEQSHESIPAQHLYKIKPSLTRESTSEEIQVINYEEQSHESIPAQHSYEIKPSLLERFKAEPVKEIIRNVHAEVLTGKSYSPENAKKWTIEIANEVNYRVKDLNMRRYKHVAQVILVEMKGAGVKSVGRCVWDTETDGFTSDIFMNDTIVCVTAVFALYLY